MIFLISRLDLYILGRRTQKLEFCLEAGKMLISNDVFDLDLVTKIEGGNLDCEGEGCQILPGLSIYPEQLSDKHLDITIWHSKHCRARGGGASAVQSSRPKDFHAGHPITHLSAVYAKKTCS